MILNINNAYVSLVMNSGVYNKSSSIMTSYIIGDIYIVYAYDVNNSHSLVVWSTRDINPFLVGLVLSQGTCSTMSVPQPLHKTYHL